MLNFKPAVYDMQQNVAIEGPESDTICSLKKKKSFPRRQKKTKLDIKLNVHVAICLVNMPISFPYKQR